MRIPFLSAAILTALLAREALAGPAIATRYTEPARLRPAGITQEACLARAEAAIAGIGFQVVERTEQSRYGVARGYTAAIRCIVDKEIVVMIVSGPERRIADDGAGLLFYAFEGVR